MSYDASVFKDERINAGFVDWLVDEQWHTQAQRYQKLWDYYQNTNRPLSSMNGLAMKRNESSRNYLQAQEVGLPPRITGILRNSFAGTFEGEPLANVTRKEVVVENDIAWRVNAMVDFLFGKGITITSKAKNSQRRREIEQIINAVFAANGGVGFFQDMAVLGSVYGFVDCIVRPGDTFRQSASNSKFADAEVISNSLQTSSFETAIQNASKISLELIEAARALPILDESDYRKIDYYVQHFLVYKNELAEEQGFVAKFLKKTNPAGKRKHSAVTEIIGKDFWQRYENKELIAEGANPLGLVPVVHIQNIAQPYFYEGISDVEPLMPLQDELNTRLSDRANRITFQAFKMYLAKGIDGIEDKEIMPGRMWCTENEDAKIEEFGGDASTPSESEHIAEVREAMDKISSITPVVAGVLKNKLGNLTSAVALKMTLMGTLSKTERKRFTYGEGIKQICSLILHTLEKAGVYKTNPDERQFEIMFPNPLPSDPIDKLEEAIKKIELGVDRERVLQELGY